MPQILHVTTENMKSKNNMTDFIYPTAATNFCNVPRGLLSFLATHTGEKLYTVCYPHWEE